MLGFGWRGKLEYPGENLPKQSREPESNGDVCTLFSATAFCSGEGLV